MMYPLCSNKHFEYSKIGKYLTNQGKYALFYSFLVVRF